MKAGNVLSVTRLSSGGPACNSPRVRVALSNSMSLNGFNPVLFSSKGGNSFVTNNTKPCIWCAVPVDNPNSNMCSDCKGKLTDPSAPEPFDDRKGK